MADHFEGPEKNLIMHFEWNYEASDLRNIQRETWDIILQSANCSILSKKSTKNLDSYILSESSLFVFQKKIIIKTCGSTALLLCVDLIIREAKGIGFILDILCFMRKNFELPEAQRWPHENFIQETRKLCLLSRDENMLHGYGQLGEDDQDHCCVFLAAKQSSNTNIDNHFYILMYDLAETARKCFYKSDDQKNIKCGNIEMRGLADMVSSTNMVDDVIFNPCGYSMNALYEDGLGTIHITPEQAYSYASFETSCDVSENTYKLLVEKAVKFFVPKRLSLIAFYSEKNPLESLNLSMYDKDITTLSISAGIVQLNVVLLNLRKI